MTKTLAALTITIVAIGMAWGLKNVIYRNKAASTETTVNDTPQIQVSTIVEPEKMPLEIQSPMSGTTVSSPDITIIGRTLPQVEVNIDDKLLHTDIKGDFSFKSTLDEGENEIVITANDDMGNFAEKTLKITYEPAQ